MCLPPKLSWPTIFEGDIFAKGGSFSFRRTRVNYIPAVTINYISNEEKEGRALSRVILNEVNEPIGVTSLTNINYEKRSCHLGSWLGKAYWGKGYNEKAKEQILDIAFNQLGLEIVFAGARAANIRSQKAQEKLPYITLNLSNLYPDEHQFLEEKENAPCVLHGFFKEDFLRFKKSIPS
jgi:RimJ/RimL family protein N-acetyltransferase